MILTKTKTKIGRQHHGRKMSLKAFEFAPVEDRYLYELARGYIVASDVPKFPHTRCVALIRRHLNVHCVNHPGSIYEILGNMECKLPILEWDSERHPDIAVYLSPPVGRRDRTLWRRWIPDFVIEVVSASSRDRDYTEKRDEYWTLGVKEYWIVDAKLEQILVLKRGRSQWTERSLGPADVCETKLLPGFKLPCKTIFKAAEERAE